MNRLRDVLMNDMNSNILIRSLPNIFTDAVEELWPGAKVRMVTVHKPSEEASRAPSGWIEQLLAGFFGHKYTKRLHWQGVNADGGDGANWYGEYRIDPEAPRDPWLEEAEFDFRVAVDEFNRNDTKYGEKRNT